MVVVVTCWCGVAILQFPTRAQAFGLDVPVGASDANLVLLLQGVLMISHVFWPVRSVALLPLAAAIPLMYSVSLALVLDGVAMPEQEAVALGLLSGFMWVGRWHRDRVNAAAIGLRAASVLARQQLETASHAALEARAASLEELETAQARCDKAEQARDAQQRALRAALAAAAAAEREAGVATAAVAMCDIPRIRTMTTGRKGASASVELIANPTSGTGSHKDAETFAEEPEAHVMSAPSSPRPSMNVNNSRGEDRGMADCGFQSIALSGPLFGPAGDKRRREVR